MSGLTVTEKEHWKERIAKRIDKRIEAIYAEDPNLKDRVQREAFRHALESLGLQQFQSQLDHIEVEKERLEKQMKTTRRAMLAHLRGVPAEKIEGRDLDDYGYGYHARDEVDRAVEVRQVVEEEQLLASDEHGRQILHLRQERENLLDTIWLSTSPKEIRALWVRLTELLGDEQTSLQQAALKIKPFHQP